MTLLTILVQNMLQDDAHIFCRESQIKDEVTGVLDFIEYTGFTFDPQPINSFVKWEIEDADILETTIKKNLRSRTQDGIIHHHHLLLTILQNAKYKKEATAVHVFDKGYIGEPYEGF